MKNDTNRKRVTLTLIILAPILTAAVLSIIYAVTGAFPLWAAARAVFRLIGVGMFGRLVRRAFASSLTKSLNKATAVCVSAAFLSHVILDTVRFAMSGGVTTVLLFPLTLPVSVVSILYFGAVDNGRRKYIKRILLIGTAAILVSACLEVYSVADAILG